MTEWTIFCAKNIFSDGLVSLFIHEYEVGRTECVGLETKWPGKAF